MKPHIEKMMKSLSKDGITLELEDPNPNLKNVVLTKGDISYKISYTIFFRLSGMSHTMKQTGTSAKGEPIYEYVKITDSMFFNQMMKRWIQMSFYYKENPEEFAKLKNKK